jgi:hypothetical protein
MLETNVRLSHLRLHKRCLAGLDWTVMS